jgi:NTE family protein
MDKSIQTEINEKCVLKKDKTILVLSGGGFRGISHVGVFHALEKEKMLKNIKTFAATSAGAIIATLYVIGYSPTEMRDFINLFDFGTFSNNIQFDNFFTDYGIDNGQNMRVTFEKMFTFKNIDKNITFAELNKKTGINLILTGVCLNDKKLYYFSHEKTPNMPVITALRISSAVPLWFSPIEYEKKFFIDGGIMNNYPISLFTDKIDNVIGVYLNEEKTQIDKIDNFESFIMNTIECLFEGMNMSLIGCYTEQTINLKLPSKANIFTSLGKKEKHEMYTFGYNETMKFLDKLNK